MVVIGEPPRPQALFAGFNDGDHAVKAMSALVATARPMPEQQWTDLRAAEWDLLVTCENVMSVPTHMHVLALGCRWLGTAKTSGGETVTFGGLQPSEVLHVADDLPDALRRLVNRDLVPWLQSQPKRPYLTRSAPFGGARAFAALGGSGGARTAPSATEVAFIRDADGHMIAGAFQRSGSGWCWALPHMPEQPEQWLALALKDWHGRTPDRVPALPGWPLRPAWTTREENHARAQLLELHEERRRQLAALSVREDFLVSAELSATAAADTGRRRLLTAQGEELVEAVVEVLKTLGYEVQNADEAADAARAPRAEDLRLTDPDAPAWTNITEVRGYTGGAKTSDLQRIERFAWLYHQRTGALPVSRWYVVNQSMDSDPDGRRDPLAGSEDDLDLFAEAGGLVIDTRALFRLVRRVEDGSISAASARAMLRQGTRVLGLFGDA